MEKIPPQLSTIVVPSNLEKYDPKALKDGRRLIQDDKKKRIASQNTASASTTNTKT